jgi:hypothetical protein
MAPVWLVVIAVAGMAAPGGLFIYWLVNDYTSLPTALADRVAVPKDVLLAAR